MTIYRRQLASSFHAMGCTLRAHLGTMEANVRSQNSPAMDEDAPDDEAADEIMDEDEASRLERQTLALEEKGAIENLLLRIERLPPDTKVQRLIEVLNELRANGYGQVMVFTQYTDTMDFLRSEIVKFPAVRPMCFSGRGGEVPNADGTGEGSAG